MNKIQHKLNVESKEPDTVNISSGWEINYWCFKLECSTEELLAAKLEVGYKISKIQESIFLTRKGDSL